MTWSPFRYRRDRDFRRVAAVLLALPHDPHFGFDTCRRMGVSAGSLYPILAAMFTRGWVKDGWQPGVTVERSRRFYMVTESGEHALRAILRGDQAVPR